MTLPLLYQDDQLIIIDKPAWSVIHVTRGADDALVLVDALAEQLGAPVFPLHRLDRQTSGILVFAQQAESASRMSEDLRGGTWRKTYVALCRGVIDDSVIVDHAVKEHGKSRSARSDVHPIETLCERYSLVHVEPHTGRRHQIRAHLKHAGHPLVGDSTYGQGAINRFFRAELGLTRLFLHAGRLRFPHPVRNERIDIVCPLASELDGVLGRLRRHRGPVA